MHWGRRLELDLRVRLQCLVDVLQTWRALNILRNRETQSHGFTVLNVRVLADNHNFELAELDMLEGIKDEFFRWKHSLTAILTFDKFISLFEGWLLKVITKGTLPVSKIRTKSLIRFQAISLILISLRHLPRY